MANSRQDRLNRLTKAVINAHADQLLIDGTAYEGHIYGPYQNVQFAGQDQGLVEPVLRIYRAFRPSSETAKIGAQVLHVMSGALYKIIQAMPDENVPWVDYKIKPLSDIA